MFATPRFGQLAQRLYCRLLSSQPNGITSRCTGEPKPASTTIIPTPLAPVPAHMDMQLTWPATDQAQLLGDMLVLDDFLSADEEKAMCNEVDPYMQRLRYEFDHWDDAIHGFRETERQHWYPHNKAVLDRVAQIAFAGSIMPYIHVLDLAENGVIKAHVDSSRYCGTTIAGLSLLSDCVMRLVRTDEKRYVQQREGSASPDEYRSLSKDGDAATSSTDGAQHYVDVLLKRRSLYIMKDTARYNFTHEILGNEHSVFKNVLVPKTRRISVICRNKP